jgi:hypothetical protein
MSLSWYEELDKLWENFSSSQSDSSLNKLKEFIEEDINRSCEDFDAFSKEIQIEYPYRKIFINEPITVHVGPEPALSWLYSPNAPIFEKSGTNAGYIILNWLVFNRSKNITCYIIDLTRFIGKHFSQICVGKIMCDLASNHGNLILLVNLHDVGVVGFCEIHNALDSNRLEILKYLYYDRNAFLDVDLYRFVSNQSSDTNEFIEEIEEDWKNGVFLNLNLKPANSNK